MDDTFYVGTEDGLIKLRAEDQAWVQQAERALKGKKVLCGRNLPRGRIVASCYKDGVYLSDDSGASWRPVDDSRLKKARCLTQAMWNGQDVLFIGTEPVGLFISKDEGDSWNEIAAVRELHEKRKWTYPVPGVDPHVRDVVVDDADGDTLYVAVQVGGVLIGRHSARHWEERGRGLNLDVHRVVVEPSNRSTFYAATGEEGIFVSKDEGNEWRRCGAEIPWTYTIPFETWGANRLVAGMGRGLPNVWTTRETGAEAVLALSKDGGETWTTSFPNKPLTSMIMTLIPAPGSKESVVVGTGVTIGADVKGEGEVYNVDLNTGAWSQLARNLPGINFIMEV
jgi:photosystem II stability/assembly factor-like uncharacterized protein